MQGGAPRVAMLPLLRGGGLVSRWIADGKRRQGGPTIDHRQGTKDLAVAPSGAGLGTRPQRSQHRATTKTGMDEIHHRSPRRAFPVDRRLTHRTVQ